MLIDFYYAPILSFIWMVKEGGTMLVSAKGRYALRMMADIARANANGCNVALRHMSESEGISLKYAEQLARSLAHGGLLESARGRDGGYRLTRPAAEISAGEVLRAAEGGKMRVVDCPALAGGCAREDICTTADFWKGLDAAIGSYVDGVSLAELVGGESCGGMFGMGISCPDADE